MTRVFAERTEADDVAGLQYGAFEDEQGLVLILEFAARVSLTC